MCLGMFNWSLTQPGRRSLFTTQPHEHHPPPPPSEKKNNMKTSLITTFEQAWPTPADIVTTAMMYKRVDKKVKPVDNAGSDGSTLEGHPSWKVRR